MKNSDDKLTSRNIKPTAPAAARLHRVALLNNDKCFYRIGFKISNQ